MGSKFKVTIVVQEEGDPADARGVRFAEDVSPEEIFDFFNRSRDAVNTLFNGKPVKEALGVTGTWAAGIQQDNSKRWDLDDCAVSMPVDLMKELLKLK
jgi:hypothetical protein